MKRCRGGDEERLSWPTCDFGLGLSKAGRNEKSE